MKRLDEPIHVRGVTIDNKPSRGLTIVGRTDYELTNNAIILTGKSTKPDHLSYSASSWRVDGKRVVACQRLFKGHYGDAMVIAEELVDALGRAECLEEATELKRLIGIWDENY